MSHTLQLRDIPVPDHVELRGQSQHYHGAIMDVVVDDIRRGEFDMKREYIRHDDAVGVVAVREGVKGEEVLLIRQYRHPVRKIMWEIPAGLLDIEGESPEIAARRELREETDYIAGDLSQLVTLYATPGCSTEKYTVFLARDCVSAEDTSTRVDEEAEIETVWLPIRDVLEAIRTGAMSSPTLVAGILAYATFSV